MDTFPAFFPLAGRRVVIAGEGEPAEAKARLFEGSPATVVRLSGDAALDPAAYAGACLVFVASYDEAFALAAAAAARGAGAPLNVVDRPALSDFHTPAIIDRGAVVGAVGTAGAAPVLASLLRAELEARIPAGAGELASLLGNRRPALRRAFPDLRIRRAFFRAVLAGPAARAVEAGNPALAGRLLDQAIAAGWSAVGGVTFIATPATPDLVSLRAVRALNVADVVVEGPGSRAIVASHARRDAERLSASSATAEVLVELVRSGGLVVVAGVRVDRSLAAAMRAAPVLVEILEAAPAQ